MTCPYVSWEATRMPLSNNVTSVCGVVRDSRGRFGGIEVGGEVEMEKEDGRVDLMVDFWD